MTTTTEPTTTTTTADVLKAMLREDTGRALCDSGGIPRYDDDGNYIGSEQGYGRRFERNSRRDFDGEPVGWLDFSYEQVEATLSTYHWLLDRVEFMPDMQAEFERYVDDVMGPGDTWLECMECYVADQHPDATGLYGSGEPMTVNTYNGESLLDQVLQFIYFENADGEAFIVLQSHNGADVRGGYSKPRVFRLTLCDGAGLFLHADATIYGGTVDQYSPLFDAHGDDHGYTPYWQTDDAYHWYADGACGRNAGRQLEDYDFTDDPDERGKGCIYVDDDGNGYCPITGERLTLAA